MGLKFRQKVESTSSGVMSTSSLEYFLGRGETHIPKKSVGTEEDAAKLLHARGRRKCERADSTQQGRTE